MGRYLALHKGSHDICRPGFGGVTRVDGGRYVVQQCKVRLKTILGGYLLDPRLGFINRTDFRKNFDMVGLEGRARNIILTTYGVQNIVFINSLYSNRELNIVFRANTIYGEISLDVPWSITD